MRVIPNTDIVYSLEGKAAHVPVNAHSVWEGMHVSKTFFRLLRVSIIYSLLPQTAEEWQASKQKPLCVRTRVCGNANVVSLKVFEILARVPQIFRTNFFFLRIEPFAMWKRQDSNEGDSSTSTVGWVTGSHQLREPNSETTALREYKPTPPGKNKFNTFPQRYSVQ